MCKRVPTVTAAFLALTLGGHLVSMLTNQSFFRATVLAREAPLDLWRMFCAHLVHSDVSHLGWNLGALLMLAWIVEQHSRLLLVSGVICGMVGVNVWFFLFASAPYYCGWSGVLNTLLLCALYSLQATSGGRSLSAARLRVHHLLLMAIGVGALAKICLEARSGITLVSDTGWRSAPGAHMAGWLTGGLLVLTVLIRTRFSSRDRTLLLSSR